MIEFRSHQQMAAHAKCRPAGYMAAVESIIVRRDARGIYYDTSLPAYDDLCRKYRGVGSAEHWQAWQAVGDRWVQDGSLPPGCLADPPQAPPATSGETQYTPVVKGAAISEAIPPPDVARDDKPGHASSLPRVGLLSHSLCVGGAERWAVDVAKHLDRRRVSFAGLAITSHENMPSHLFLEAQRAGPIFGGRDGYDRLAARCDVLLYSGVATPPNNCCASVVFVSHGSCRWSRNLAACALERGDRPAAVSEAAATVFPRPGDVAVVHNGIDLARCEPRVFRKTTRAEWGLSADQVAIGFVGRISSEKNPQAAALAAKALGPGHVPVFVGTTLDRRVKRECAAACPRAKFFPPADHIGDVLAAIDCFVLASPSEGCSLGLFEAWAAGVPTVATRVGAVPELEKKFGQLAIAVPVNPTSEQLAAAVRRALSPDNGPVVQRAKSIVRKHFTARTMGAAWTDLIVRTFG